MLLSLPSVENLRVRVGIDLVSIPRLTALLSDTAFLQHAFQPVERQDSRPEHLAGILAAKEACFKAIGRQPIWLAVVVAGSCNHPQLSLAPAIEPPGLVSLDVSITHEGDYAVAAVVMLLREEASVDELP